jgi:hypothetical protein
MGISLPPRLQRFQQPKRARSAYGRHKYSGGITVFSPVEGPAWVDHHPDMGWEGLADEGLEIHELGSYAHMIFEPFVGDLANRLAGSIEKAQTVPQGNSGRSPEAFGNHQVLEQNVSLSIAGD